MTLSYIISKKHNKKFQSAQLECFYPITVNSFCACMSKKLFFITNKVLHRIYFTLFTVV